MFSNPLLGADLVADPDAPPANRLLRYEPTLSPERASECFHHERSHRDLAGSVEALRVRLMDAPATAPAGLAHLVSAQCCVVGLTESNAKHVLP